jgi:hypothetical protein
MNDIPENYPVQRHTFCQMDYCETCLEDHMALEKYLDDKCKSSYPTDFLGKYRTFLDEHLSHCPETQTGWAHPACFEPHNIDAFIAAWRTE